jgi:flagellar hook protein FlgE
MVGRMNAVMNIALSGLQSSTARFERSASRTVADPYADLPAELVAQKMAENEFRANLTVIKAADRMMKSALDILV